MALIEAMVSDITGSTSLVAAIRSAGIEPDWRHPWLHVGHTVRQEGWKLHLTCTPLALHSLLRALLDARRQFDFEFKIVGTSELAALLNEGQFGATQVGKCATVYPRDDAEFQKLARAFDRTASFSGPAVPDDVRLGKVVFCRFGGFNPVVRRDRLGQTQLLITGDDGELTPDAYDKMLAESRFRRDFAAAPVLGQLREEPEVSAALAERGYRVVGTLKDSVKGRLFQALDLTDQGTVGAVIIKEGRKHVLSDLQGFDIRDRLRHQHRSHAVAAPLGIAPTCGAYFEVDGNGYLPIAFQPNDNFERWIQSRLRGRVFDDCSPTEKTRIVSALAAIGTGLEKLHAVGMIHRDLSPSNVLLDERDRPLLSDLEICWSPDAPAVFGKGTPGFMAPEQAAMDTPRPENDVFGYAALCLYSLTGIDPRRIPMPEAQDWQSGLQALANSLPSNVWRILERALSPNPDCRPALAEISAGLDAHQLAQSPRRPHLTPSQRARLLHQGTTTLASPAVLTEGRRLWFSIPLDGQRQGSPELRRSLNRGAAGPLLYCAAYARFFNVPQELRVVCAEVAQWLVEDRDAQDFGMPGLNFGEAGVLLALYAARASGLADFRDREVAHLWHFAFDPTDFWTDVTHGHAGLVIASLELQALLSTCGVVAPVDLTAARTQLIAELLNAQLDNGSWRAAGGVPGMSGEVMSGFAHGVAGIGYALLASSTPQPAELDAARRAADWLLHAAQRDAEGRPAWPYSDRNAERWNWWCHGAPGIALFLGKLWRETGAEVHRQTALDCFAGIPRRYDPANLSLCHGLAGIGELMLDTGRLCEDPTLIDRAAELATVIQGRHFRGRQDLYWIVENPELTSADLMVGMSGVLHFLLRLETGDTGLRFPGT